jgi:A/G-specific adenine glycosylase
LATLEHGFTHFKLSIEPWLVRPVRRNAHATEPGGSWLALEEALQVALPAPVRILLEGLRNKSLPGINAPSPDSPEPGLG